MESGRFEIEIVAAFVVVGNGKVKDVTLGVTEVRKKM